jgi:hypothetical protein
MSYFFDGLLICIRAVWAHCWEPSQLAVWRALDGYVVSCLVAFVGCVVAMSWEERGSGQLGGWGKIYTGVFGTQALLGEMVIGISCLMLLTRCTFQFSHFFFLSFLQTLYLIRIPLPN